MSEELTKQGMLYLSATPIGNLEDMTLRGIRMLGEADLIAAEDTRHSRKLLAHFDIHTPLTSYHEHNKLDKGPELVEKMLAGDTIVCISDAGLPGISDPGAHLAQLAIDAGIKVSPLPGANAALSALICSGLDTTAFTFYGFLPKTGKKRRELLEQIARKTETLIFYEAPHHLKSTLGDLVKALGPHRPAATARELTKKFEEFRRCTLGDLADYYREHEPKGEFVIIVGGYDNDEADLVGPAEQLSPRELVEQMEAAGMGRKEAMRETAKKLGISRRDVYQALLDEFT
ncbi:MAG: 16S rRNA (cytidine(1402)-2'-O)-methyltransferase [Anaerovibrio sp.]|uniref:16S rRNA (cytidine(1402)-2'-O)-methyltransferase n=1 Tax=Anaerovibrio sp. TaxID=1872532 RepID=UPI0025C33011|nr:16S rRNA (cytidine(1402)-2'-O)-methyltransferase [Anaerovibrio sp.]MBE6099131.1 16S rRNA (cytidine(1402)-2'-O)-methyltransferase [Anaerovibrio sp.]